MACAFSATGPRRVWLAAAAGIALLGLAAAALAAPDAAAPTSDAAPDAAPPATDAAPDAAPPAPDAAPPAPDTAPPAPDAAPPAPDAAPPTPDTAPPGKVAIVRGGSVVATYATIQQAIDKGARPGDTIRLGQGTFFECVKVNVDGLPDKRIILEGPGGTARATIDGAYEPWTTPGKGLWKKDGTGPASWAAAPGFVLQRGRRMPSAAIRGGVRLWTYATRAAFDAFKVGSGVYWDATAARVYIRFSDGRDPNTVALSISRCDHALAFGTASDWTVRGITVQNGSYATITIGFFDRWAAHITIDGVTVRNGMNGIVVSKLQSKRNVVRKSTISSTFGSGWYWSDFYDNPSAMPGSGILLLDAGSGTQVHDNAISGFFDGISTLTGGKPDGNAAASIYRNTISRAFDDGIELESYDRDTLVFFNTVYDAYVALSVSPVRGGPTYIFRNLLIANRAINSQRKGSLKDQPVVYKAGAPAGGAASRNVKVYHNTSYSLARVVDGGWGGPVMPQGFEWYNNIFYSRGGVLVANSGLAAAGNRFDGNIYFRRDVNEIFKRWNCTATGCGFFKTLAAARASAQGVASGWEKAGIQDDPRFLSPLGTRPDLRLHSSSPARDRAIPLPAGWPDPVKAVGTKKDPGAIEYGSPEAADGGWPPNVPDGGVAPPPPDRVDVEVALFKATAVGSVVTFDLTLCNRGTAKQTFQAALWFDRASPPACSASDAEAAGSLTLAAAACTTITTSVSAAITGKYTAYLMVDADCTIRESNEGNNLRSASYTLSGGSADIQVTALTATATGGNVSYGLTICSKGAATRPFTVKVWLHRPTAPTCASTDAADAEGTIGLGAGECLSATLDVSGMALGNYTAWVLADSGCQVPESDEANNARSVLYSVRAP